MTNKESLIEKWINGSLSAEEEKKLRESGELSTIKKLWGKLDDVEAPQFNTEAALTKFHNARQPKGGKAVSLNPFIRYGSIAAAVVILLLSFVFIFQNLNSNVTTVSEVKKQKLLPDSSTFILNKSSQLSYAEESWNNQRIVKLEGEAFFEVEKGSSFKVKTKHSTVEVLGTKFNVKERGDYVEVICYEGKVQLSSNEKSIILLPTDGVQLFDGRLRQFSRTEAQQPEWLSGESTFDRTPYRYVLLEIEQQYDITIETNAIDLKQTFSGKIPHNQLETALEMITVPSDYQYTINRNKVKIIGDTP